MLWRREPYRNSKRPIFRAFSENRWREQAPRLYRGAQHGEQVRRKAKRFAAIVSMGFPPAKPGLCGPSHAMGHALSSSTHASNCAFDLFFVLSMGEIHLAGDALDSPVLRTRLFTRVRAGQAPGRICGTGVAIQENLENSYAKPPRISEYIRAHRAT